MNTRGDSSVGIIATVLICMALGWAITTMGKTVGVTQSRNHVIRCHEIIGAIPDTAATFAIHPECRFWLTGKE